MSNEARLEASLKGAWEDFAFRVQQTAEEVQMTAERGDSVHKLIWQLANVNYWSAKGLVLNGPSISNPKQNAGSVTGLLFELLLGAAVCGYVRNRCPGAQFYVGSRSPQHPRWPRVQVNPDLCVEVGSRLVVFEFKSAAQIDHLKHMLLLRDRYQEAGHSFFFIGGHVRAKAAVLNDALKQQWAVFFEVSARNAKSVSSRGVDWVFQESVRRLQAQ